MPGKLWNFVSENVTAMNKPLTVAFADDFTGWADLLSRIFKAKGLVMVCNANNGKELLEKIALLPEVPDVCLLDIEMPVMEGYETATELRRLYPTMGILAFKQCCEDMERMLRCGADGYVRKVCSIAELINGLNKVYAMQRVSKLTIS